MQQPAKLYIGNGARVRSPYLPLKPINMGMDVDFITAKLKIERLKEILRSFPHGEHGEICDDIEKFVKNMEEKYSKYLE